MTVERDLSDQQVGMYVQQAAGASNVSDPGVLAAAMEVLLSIDPKTDKPRWSRYIHPADRRKYQWDDFGEFCKKHLQTTPSALVGYLDSFPDLSAKILMVATGPIGVNTNGDGSNTTIRHSNPGKMARLMRERPDLAEKVVSREKTITAAMIEAGYNQPYASIRIDTPEAAIDGLLRRFTHDQLERALAKHG